MKTKEIHSRTVAWKRRLVVLSGAGIVGGGLSVSAPTALPLGGAAVATTALALWPTPAEGQTIRAEARRVSRRTSRRTSRRVARRHMYAMPVGYRVVPYGRYRYYYAGGLYYYPYMLGGRTVYVQVDVNPSGQPLPPPPPTEVQVDINY